MLIKQPEGGLLEDIDDLFEPSTRNRGVPVQKWVESQANANPSNRLAGDRELYDVLAEQNFSGPDYKEFELELITYGYAVIRAWIRDEKIIEKCTALRISGIPAGLADFHLSETEILDLTTDIVVDGVDRFHRDSLVGKRWDPSGTASMKTFFIRRCLFSTPSPMKQIFRRKTQEKELLSLDSLEEKGTFLAVDDSSEAVENDMILLSLIGKLGTLDQEVFRLSYEEYKHAEIAKKLGLTPKAVGRRLDRIRSTLRDAKDIDKSA